MPAEVSTHVAVPNMFKAAEGSKARHGGPGRLDKGGSVPRHRQAPAQAIWHMPSSGVCRRVSATEHAFKEFWGAAVWVEKRMCPVVKQRAKGSICFWRALIHLNRHLLEICNLVAAGGTLQTRPLTACAMQV
eukprot:scaffold43653_cov19-Tisochrysis_lutea.AAC.2